MKSKTVVEGKNGMYAELWYDDTSGNTGWYALYLQGYGMGVNRVVGDSMKVWHSKMPRRTNAIKEAVRIVKRHLRSMD
jgi:hypothetical protein